MKKFIKKLVADVKFADAGPGHRLNAEQPSSSRPSTARDVSRDRARVVPSRDAQSAGAAALARLEAQNNKSSSSLNAQKLQLKKQTQREQQTSSQLDSSGPREPVMIQQLGLRMLCPICSVSLPKPEMSSHYETCLEQQLEREPLKTTCTMIHTLNSGDLLINGVKTLTFFVENVIKYPTEEKYKKIRIKNAGVQKKIIPLTGGTEFLEIVGFTRIKDDTDEEEYYILLETPPIEHLKCCVETLKSSVKLLPTLDRDIKVLPATTATVKLDFSEDFYRITRQDLENEQKRRNEDLARSKLLRTKEMRDRDAGIGMRIYCYTVVKVRFPDNIYLQGTFSAHDAVESIFKFVDDSLRRKVPYTLITPGCPPLRPDKTTLKAAGLVPSVTFNLSTSERIDFTLLSDEYVCKLSA